MTTTAPSALLPHLWKSTLVSGILTLALGVVIWLWPGRTLVVAAILFGAYLLISGIVQVIFAFSLHVSTGGRVLLFISGAASLILALLCFRSLLQSLVLLAIWIGVGFISAISDPHVPGRLWHVFIGVISLLAGIVMMASPFASLGVLALVVAIWLIVLGAFEVVSSFGIRRASKSLVNTPPVITAGGAGAA
jgi:uncharacterized membrane protein HdeD (DUF308 family)